MVLDKLHKENNEVLYRRGELFNLQTTILEDLISAAAANPRERARICLHSSPGDPIHEMLIVHRAGSYVRPHRHLTRDESIIVLAGEADLLFFDEKGGIDRLVHLTPFGGKGSWYQRIERNHFHTMLVRSEWLMFFEVTSGPFNSASTEMAHWAPSDPTREDGSDSAVTEYLKKLHQLCQDR